MCLVAQLCPTLCDPINCSLPGSSVHGIFQARILEWVAIPLPKRSSQHRDWTQVSCITSRFFTVWATREAPFHVIFPNIFLKSPSQLMGQTWPRLSVSSAPPTGIRQSSSWRCRMPRRSSALESSLPTGPLLCYPYNGSQSLVLDFSFGFPL